MAVDKTAALAELADMVAATQRPVLDTAALTRLLDRYAIPDRYGRWVDDPDWEGNWNMPAAAAEGWRRKGAQVAGDFTFSADGASYSKGDLLAHCEAMARQYQAQSGLTIQGVADDRTHRPYSSPRLAL